MKIYDKVDTSTVGHQSWTRGLQLPFPHQVHRQCHRFGHCRNPIDATSLGDTTHRFVCGGDQRPYGLPYVCGNPT